MTSTLLKSEVDYGVTSLPPLPGAQGRSLLRTGPGDARPAFAEWRDFRLLLKRHRRNPKRLPRTKRWPNNCATNCRAMIR